MINFILNISYKKITINILIAISVIIALQSLSNSMHQGDSQDNVHVIGWIVVSYFALAMSFLILKPITIHFIIPWNDRRILNKAKIDLEMDLITQDKYDKILEEYKRKYY